MNCRCWIYNEGGHYANECFTRTKGKYKKKIKMLEQINAIGYEPTKNLEENDKFFLRIRRRNSKTKEYDTESYSESN
jgi:hypothetical protein